jgi:hypothetical protein
MTFRDLKMLALEFYNNNPELFKQGVEGEEVLKTMIEKGYTFGKRYMKEEDQERRELSSTLQSPIEADIN